MKKDTVVLFDIDYTLFDTELFRGKLYKAISDVLNFSQMELTKVQQEALDYVRIEVGYFHPVKFSEFLSSALGREKEKDSILKALFQPEIFLDNYYEETEEILRVLSQKVTVGIFSKGHTRFQKEKIRKIIHLLNNDHIHITTNKYTRLPKVLSRYKNKKLYIVDDALGVLHKAKQLRADVFVVWVKRGFYATKQEPIEGFVPDAIIGNLSELLPIVLGK